MALYVIDADEFYLLEYVFVFYEFCVCLLAHDLTDLNELLESLIPVSAIKKPLLFFNIYKKLSFHACLLPEK